MPRHLSPARPSRRRFAPIALIGGVAATSLLALSLTGTLSGFTAQITNSANSAASGTLIMQEQNSGATVTCTSTDAGSNSNSINTNASVCSGINKYGGSTVLVPGASSTTTITIKNVGTVPANTFTLQPGSCTQGNNGTINGSASDFCAKLAVVITQTVGTTTTTVSPASSTATSLAGTTITLTAPVAPAATVTYTFTVTLAASATNTYQGLSASQPLVWTFTS